MRARKCLVVSVFGLAITALAGCSNPLSKLFSKESNRKVTWKNYDGSILEIDENVGWIRMPEYNGKTPTKPMDDAATYEFAGWDKILMPVTQSVTYTATYNSTPRQYTVKWLNYDNSLISQSSVAYGSVPEYTGSTPTRAGNLYSEYVFSGWDRPLAPVTGEASYKATFTETKFSVFTVSYQFNPTVHEVVNSNATDGDVTLLRAGESLTLANPTCVGYDFAGWYSDANRTKPISSIPNISSSMTIYGKFDVHTYQITYNVNGGEEGTFGPSEITCLEEADLLPTTKTGYGFVTWKDQHGKALSHLEDVCEDLQLTANFNPNKYTITLRYSEQNDKYITVYYDQSINIKRDYAPSRAGYTFLGWFYEDNQDEEFLLTQYTLLHDVYLVQKWSEPIEYTIAYSLNGGTNPDGAPEVYSAVNKPELPVPTRDGYEFLGWFFNGQKVTTLREYFTNLTLEARWEAKDVSLTFDYDGGSLRRSINFYDGEELESSLFISPAEKVGFRVLDDKADAQFNGWANELGQRETFAADKTADADVNLKAIWTPVRSDSEAAKINADSNFGVNGFNYKIYQYTPLVNQTVKFSSEGSFDLKGELKNASGSTLASNDDVSSEDLNFSFLCSLNANTTYYLKVSSNSEASGNAVIKAESQAEVLIPQGTINASSYTIESSMQKFDENFISVGEPVKEGKVFDGWVDEDNQKYDSSTQLKKLTINLKATWIDA